LKHSQVGIDIIDISTGEELLSFNGQKRFTPASTAKVFATALAYERLGPGFTYKTRLFSKSPIQGGNIQGDLILVPCQDPTLGADDLKGLFNLLAARGLRHVDGNLIEQDVPSGGERFQPEWLSEDWAQDWMPVSSSLVVDRNIGSPNTLSRTRITTRGPADTGNALERSLLASDYTEGWLSFAENSRSLVVFQAAKQGNARSSEFKAIGNPDAYNRALTQDIAERAGIKFSNHWLKWDAFGKTIMLAEHHSATLDKIIKTTLRDSDNLYAQQILRTLGLTRENSGTDGKNKNKNGLTLEQSGLQKISHWLNTIGVLSDEVVLWDGCGLSRKDFVTPHALSSVLRHMAINPQLNGYVALLTPATIKPQGTFQFKTGAMDSVRTVTGILQNGQGQRLAVTIMVNGHGPSVRDLRTSIGILVNNLAATDLPLKGADAQAAAQ
jgi:D-alanyl-D-alanine carboxypeptidase/D-alanyl-D-alanine-endopeptidase (penicillin-binding protein 4)